MTEKLACVLVTRPAPEGSELCRLIEAEGGRAYHFPTIAFMPPKINPDLALAQLDQQDWWIFNSPQAVHAGLPAIFRLFPKLPSRVKLAAIGAGTKKALQQAGHSAILQPESEWNSEGVLNLTEFHAVKDKKIAIIKGEGGRELLETRLTERGAKVLAIAVYQRVLPQIGPQDEDFLPQIQVVICTSYEGLCHLKSLLSTAAFETIKKLPLIVASERVKRLAQDLDFQTIWVAHNASSEAILAILKSEGKI